MDGYVTEQPRKKKQAYCGYPCCNDRPHEAVDKSPLVQSLPGLQGETLPQNTYKYTYTDSILITFQFITKQNAIKQPSALVSYLLSIMNL